MIKVNKIVDVPEKTKMHKRKNATYVYVVTEQVYLKDKQYVKENRKCIGKLYEQDESKMYPNDNYYLFFGTNAKEELVGESPKLSDTLQVGQTIVMEKICKDLGLDEIINSLSPKNAEILQALCYYFIDERSSVMQLFNKWARNKYQNLKDIPSDSTISKILNNEISNKDIELFLEAWNSLLVKLNDEKFLISYDSTNMNTSSSTIELAEYGYAKEKENLPQINLAYAINQRTGLPLFYELYPGSIIDQTQCKLMIDKASNFGYKKACFVLDRGYFSQTNLEYFHENSYDFVIMAKTYNKLIKELLKEYRPNIKNNVAHMIKEHGVYSVKVKGKCFEKDKNEYYIHIYYNDFRAALERKELIDKLSLFERNLRNVKYLTEDIERTYGKFFAFETDKDKKILNIRINSEENQRYLDEAGYFVIISSYDEDSSELLNIYRKRNAIEKTFAILKTSLDCNKYGVQNNQAVQSKAWLGFLSSIIRSHFSQQTKEILEANSSATVNTLLAELSHIEVTYNGNRYRKRYALTAKQKNILKCFNIDENYIDEIIRKYNQKLL